MNNFVKNILLLIIVLALSYYTAEYFGTWYDKFSPQYDNTLGVSKALLISLAGFPFAYIFFTILLFKLFSFGNRNKWIGWLLVPPLLFFGSCDHQHKIKTDQLIYYTGFS